MAQVLSESQPIINGEREPMLLLDVTGSMQSATSATDKTSRCDTIREAIGGVVAILAAADSQALRENEALGAGKKQEGEEEEAGGLRTVTFAGESAQDIGDLNPTNLEEKWKSIEWSGSTYIVPGWNKILDVYAEEFGARPQSEQPSLILLVTTDGEASDGDAFAKILERYCRGKIFVQVAVIGDGALHDRTMNQYGALAARFPQLKVENLTAEVDPVHMTSKLLAMLGE